MTISSQEKHNFSLCSCFHAHPTTLILKILGGPMHERSPHLKFWGGPSPSPPIGLRPCLYLGMTDVAMRRNGGRYRGRLLHPRNGCRDWRATEIAATRKHAKYGQFPPEQFPGHFPRTIPLPFWVGHFPRTIPPIYYAYIHIHVCIHTSTYIHAYIYTHAYTHTYTHIYIHTYTCIHIHEYIYIHTYTDIHTYTYVCMYASTLCMYVCMYTYMYIV